MNENLKKPKALIAVACVIVMYILSAGFVLAPIENHMPQEALQAGEKVYTPLVLLYEKSSIYRKLVDWQDGVADGW